MSSIEVTFFFLFFFFHFYFSLPRAFSTHGSELSSANNTSTLQTKPKEYVSVRGHNSNNSDDNTWFRFGKHKEFGAGRLVCSYTNVGERFIHC